MRFSGSQRGESVAIGAYPGFSFIYHSPEGKGFFQPKAKNLAAEERTGRLLANHN
jgi:hypothetical protein